MMGEPKLSQSTTGQSPPAGSQAEELILVVPWDSEPDHISQKLYKWQTKQKVCNRRRLVERSTLPGCFHNLAGMMIHPARENIIVLKLGSFKLETHVSIIKENEI